MGWRSYQCGWLKWQKQQPAPSQHWAGKKLCLSSRDSVLYPILLTGNPRLVPPLSQKELAGTRRQDLRENSRSPSVWAQSLKAVGDRWLRSRDSALMDRTAVSRCAKSRCFWDASSSDYESGPPTLMVWCWATGLTFPCSGIIEKSFWTVSFLRFRFIWKMCTSWLPLLDSNSSRLPQASHEVLWILNTSTISSESQ